MQSIVLSVNVGPLTCDQSNYDTLCGGDPAPALPPAFELTVDYGDGSPAATWSPGDPRDVFEHSYALPGDYQIVVTSEY